MMKIRFDLKSLFALSAVLALCLAGCGGDDPVEPAPPAPTVLRVIVRSEVDSALIENSNVVLYRAETREAVVRGMTDSGGSILFNQPMGNYYVEISAQGFETTPPESITPIPFFLAAEDTTIQDISLDPLEETGDTGFVIGFVEPATNNFLILAESQVSRQNYSTASGPDGVFVLYNLPYGSYALDALKSGYMMVEPVSTSVTAEAPVDTARVPVAEYVGSQLAGSVTFLASENSTVDITLLDRETRSVVPGLTVRSEPAGLNYAIAGIPDGDYLAWASLENDGYVIDPDWLFKNPNGLDIDFTSATSAELNFSVTGALTLVSPTNAAATTIPEIADSAVPTFRWMAYPSTKEYFIEVRDLSGDLLWGGFDSDGMANHAFIAASQVSVQYNFDNQPGVPVLEPGQIYQWRLWADKGTQFDSFVEQLISSSEDLQGIFQIPVESAAR
jgi:hypothetical protein